MELGCNTIVTHPDVKELDINGELNSNQCFTVTLINLLIKALPTYLRLCTEHIPTVAYNIISDIRGFTLHMYTYIKTVR